MSLLQIRNERRAEERRIAERNETILEVLVAAIGFGLLTLAVLPWMF